MPFFFVFPTWLFVSCEKQFHSRLSFEVSSFCFFWLPLADWDWEWQFLWKLIWWFSQNWNYVDWLFSPHLPSLTFVYICICVFVYLYWPNKGFFYKHNFSNFFYQTQNFSLNVCFISFRVLWKWQLVDPFKGLMILENFLWKAPSDAFCNFATF